MRYRYSHALDWDQQSWSLPISLNPVSTQPGEGQSDQLAYQRWREPERYDFYAEMELDVRLFAGVPSSGSLIVHSPGVLMRCPLSNVVTVPRSDLVESLSN
jgi:hypothetical protein